MAKVKRIRISPLKALQAANESLAKQNADLQYRVGILEREANERIGKDMQDSETQSEGRIYEGTRAQRHATRAGPNSADDIYPPGCGPMQLVWSVVEGAWDPVTIGWQGDSFHQFPNKMAAVSWLLGIAQRVMNDKVPPRT